jgi:hypothetical protein
MRKEFREVCGKERPNWEGTSQAVSLAHENQFLEHVEKAKCSRASMHNNVQSATAPTTTDCHTVSPVTEHSF